MQALVLILVGLLIAGTRAPAVHAQIRHNNTASASVSVLNIERLAVVARVHQLTVVALPES
jgi:hypothetical protein